MRGPAAPHGKRCAPPPTKCAAPPPPLAAQVGQTVLTAVLCLAHDNEVEENRVVATQLLGAPAC